jgi:DMSO/TMAO reductase YedYZ molybdopterin-dependent catalytic subunit/thiosulfate reductase cytochrome b subunit
MCDAGANKLTCRKDSRMSLILSYIALGDASFPWWLRASHWINAFFIGYLIRAGIQILGSYPRLYWNDDSAPGHEWLKLTRRKIPTNRVWTSLEQELNVPSWLGHPGGNNLGLGRIWHFFIVIFWILNGVVYIALLILSGEWTRLVPTDWSIFPRAWETFLTYATFQLPPASEFQPYDALQQLTYFAVVFLLGPFLIATGAAQSPAIAARFPWYLKIFGGRQAARSLHFLGLLAFVAFIAVHTLLVIVTGAGKNFALIFFGQAGAAYEQQALFLVPLLILLIFAIYALTAWYTLRQPRRVQQALGRVLNPVVHRVLGHARSRQEYEPEDISPYFILNGSSPKDVEYRRLAETNYADWRLEVTGLVNQSLILSLDGVRALPRRCQITKHHCIQGWTGIAQWEGASLRDVLALAKPLPQARYAVFWSYGRDTVGKPFYEALTLEQATHAQTILAYRMNDQPLSVEHGAPLRLRCETVLGYKMVKWLCRIELVADFRMLGEGQGGSREDNRYYEPEAGI